MTYTEGKYAAYIDCLKLLRTHGPKAGANKIAAEAVKTWEEMAFADVETESAVMDEMSNGDRIK